MTTETVNELLACADASHVENMARERAKLTAAMDVLHEHLLDQAMMEEGPLVATRYSALLVAIQTLQERELVLCMEEDERKEAATTAPAIPAN